MPQRRSARQSTTGTFVIEDRQRSPSAACRSAGARRWRRPASPALRRAPCSRRRCRCRERYRAAHRPGRRTRRAMSSTDLARRRHLARAVDEVARREDDRVLGQRARAGAARRRSAGPTRYSTSGCAFESRHGAAQPLLPDAIPLGGAEHDHEAFGARAAGEARARASASDRDRWSCRRHPAEATCVPAGRAARRYERRARPEACGRETWSRMASACGAEATMTRTLRSSYFCRRNSACAPAYASVGDPLDVEILGVELDGALAAPRARLFAACPR